MARIRTLLIGSAVGAAAAYFFDPELGKARRARLQDQVGARVREGTRALERTVRQLGDRAQGAVAQLEAAGRPHDDDDLTVLSRVESTIFGMRDFPKGSINAEVVDGQLVLRGEVASQEQEREIVEAAGRVRGVVAVESLLHLPGTPAPNKAAARRVR
ncbi:MAG TPA: BON domain-containing protein [Candidatus Eisenbacteria bacterium]|nr:BON domain-containing protein [Candidatus Eisenbacteria bacterium]